MMFATRDGANEAEGRVSYWPNGQLRDSLATLAALVGDEKIEIYCSILIFADFFLKSLFCALFSKKSIIEYG